VVDTETTQFDKALQRIKNHKFLSVILLLGVIVVAIGSFTDALTRIASVFSRDSEDQKVQNPEVTDVLVLRSEKGRRILDVRILNNSTNTIIVSRLRLKALSFEDRMKGKPRLYAYSPVTAVYETNLGELTAPGRSIEVPVSHVVEPGQTDRFIVTVGMKGLERDDQYAWKLGTELVTSVGLLKGHEVYIELP
jgi:hypothetical protein